MSEPPPEEQSNGPEAGEGGAESRAQEEDDEEQELLERYFDRRTRNALVVLAVLTPVLIVAVWQRMENPEVVPLPERRGASYGKFGVPDGVPKSAPAVKRELRKMAQTGRMEELTERVITAPVDPERFELGAGERREAERILKGAGVGGGLEAPTGKKLTREEWALVQGFTIQTERGEETVAPIHDILSDVAFYRASLGSTPGSTGELLAGTYPVRDLSELSERNRYALLAPYIPPGRSGPIEPFSDRAEPLSLQIEPLNLTGEDRQRIIELFDLEPLQPPEGWEGPPPLGGLYLVTVYGEEGGVVLRWVYKSFAARGTGE